MMFPGQTVLGGIGQDAAQHTAQRVARQHVVSDVIGRHGLPCRMSMSPSGRRKCRSPTRTVCRMLLRLKAWVSTVSGEYSGKNPPVRERKWRLLLPGASEPRLTELNPSGL